MVILSKKERSVYKAFETLYSGICLTINVTGIRFDIRIIESKAKVTFLTCCHKIMLSQFMVHRAKISLSPGSMFTYRAYTRKGFSDAFICMNRHENISYNLKMCSTGVASSLLFWETAQRTFRCLKAESANRFNVIFSAFWPLYRVAGHIVNYSSPFPR